MGNSLWKICGSFGKTVDQVEPMMTALASAWHQQHQNQELEKGQKEQQYSTLLLTTWCLLQLDMPLATHCERTENRVRNPLPESETETESETESESEKERGTEK
ncbi:hypothetical protein ACLKA7_016172 [Drosophila subpalustris]